MTKEELEDILHALGLDYEAEANQIYVFYVLPDGRVDNFSLTVRRGARMSDADILTLMHREYPATRQGTVMSVERPDGFRARREELRAQLRPEEWMEAHDVCAALKISRRTLQRWTRRGVFRGVRVGERVYYSRADIDDAMRSNIVMENGRIDGTASLAR